MEDDLSKELDLQIQGAEKPSMWNLVAVQFLLLPYTIGKVCIYILPNRVNENMRLYLFVFSVFVLNAMRSPSVFFVDFLLKDGFMLGGD